MEKLFIVVKDKRSGGNVSYDRLETLISKWGKSLITFELPDTNPHYHIILETDEDPNNVRNTIAYNFSLTGRDKQVGLVRKPLSAYAYILKDGDIKHNSLFSEETIQNLKELSYQKPVKEKKKKRETKVDPCINTYKKIQKYQINMNGLPTSESMEKIIRHIYKHIYKTYDKPFNKPIVEKIYYLLFNKHYNLAFTNSVGERWILEKLDEL